MRERFVSGKAVRALLLILLLLLAQGCLGRSPAVRHFLLGTGETQASAAEPLDVAVVVGPARLPAYLDRSQIATLVGGGEVELDEFNRWLGGFRENFLRAISLGLARELGSSRIVAEPSRAPFQPDYRIRLHVDDLISREGEGLRVALRWALMPSGDKGSTRLFVMNEIVPIKGRAVEDLVRAHDELISELVDRIAEELVSFESEG